MTTRQDINNNVYAHRPGKHTLRLLSTDGRSVKEVQINEFYSYDTSYKWVDIFGKEGCSNMPFILEEN